jgi:glyoxylase-like metal-dependent hydrolase (beta-lactamase superfamily II)
MVETDVAPGIHRVNDAYTNWYLVQDGDSVTLVDAGTPDSWASLHEALGAIGRSSSDIAAVVLTHAHYDHVGFAGRAQRELGVPVYVHEDDAALARHPLLYERERPVTAYLATQPRALPIVLSLLRHRAFWPDTTADLSTFANGSLDVPGSPRLIATPGHTRGHVALHFPERDAVIAGDAVVMLDPYTARRGPRLVARAATADVPRNLESLGALAETGAKTVLTGHGEPWHGGAEAAVEQARRAGSA